MECKNCAIQGHNNRRCIACTVGIPCPRILDVEWDTGILSGDNGGGELKEDLMED
jgi:hypothetical protein